MTVRSTIRRIWRRQCGQFSAGCIVAGMYLAACLPFAGACAAVARAQLAVPLQGFNPAQRSRPVMLTEGELPSGYVGLPFHTSVAVTGGSGLYSIITSGELPQGVVLIRGGGTMALSGVPTVAGDFQLRVAAADMQGGSSMSRTYDFHIGPQPAATQVTTVSISQSEAFHFTDVDSVFFPAKIADNEASKFNDGDAAFMPAIIRDSEVFHFTDAINVFGPSKPMDADVFHFTDTVLVRLSAMIFDAESFKLADAVSVVTKVGISPTTAPAGNSSSAYNQAFTVVGATATPSISFNGATLPTGLSFNCSGATCTLSGTPTQVGTFPFALTAKDTLGSTVRSSTTVSYSLVINGKKQTIDFPQPNSGVVYSSYMLSATASSGLPVTFSIVSGPATLSGTNNSTITFTGTGEVIVAADQAGNAVYAAAPTVQDPIDSEIVNYVMLVNNSGTVTKIVDRGMVVGTAGVAGTTSTMGGVAIDSASNAWTVSKGNNQLVVVNAALSAATSYTSGGINGPAAVAIDGAGSVWVANMTGNSVLQFTNAGVPISPTNGYTGVTPSVAGYSAPAGIAIDISGNVWVTNSSANTLIEILGGAAPASPLSTGVTNNTTGTRP